jgi:hypothetical protein
VLGFADRVGIVGRGCDYGKLQGAECRLYALGDVGKAGLTAGGAASAGHKAIAGVLRRATWWGMIHLF